MKQKLINKVIELLEAEYKVYEEMFRISKEKTNFIVEGKVSELDNIVKLEQAMVLQVSKIDKQREDALSQFSQLVGVGENGLNISEIKKHADEGQNRKLVRYQEEMTRLVKELSHINQLNAKLIKNSLDFIELSLNLISNADVSSNNYEKKGNASGKSNKNLFDMKL